MGTGLVAYMLYLVAVLCLARALFRELAHVERRDEMEREEFRKRLLAFVPTHRQDAAEQETDPEPFSVEEILEERDEIERFAQTHPTPEVSESEEEEEPKAPCKWCDGSGCYGCEW